MEHRGETTLTEAMQWLIESHGLGAMRPDEIDAIRDFTLLWGLFEGKAMATDGSPAELVAAGAPRGAAASIVARLTGVPRNTLYSSSL